MFNPRITGRSAEKDMRPWDETCLVLPEGLTVSLLRDDVVELSYEDVSGVTRVRVLGGEEARAAQHELDHDQGILILDHADLDALPRDVREREREGHEERQERAFSRQVAVRERVPKDGVEAGRKLSKQRAGSATRGREDVSVEPVDGNRGAERVYGGSKANAAKMTQKRRCLVFS